MENIYKYGYTDTTKEFDTALYKPARIIAVHRESYEFVCDLGLFRGVLKAGVYFTGLYDTQFPCVGDFVLIAHNPAGDSQIVKTLPAKSYFSRKDPDKGKGEQMLAANFDYVFIISSLNRDFNPKRIERYMAMAWQSGGHPVIILTKLDLCDNSSELIAQAQAASIGADLFAVSAKTGEGMDELNRFLEPGKTAVLLGSSGVGKSSLVNAIAGCDIMKTGEVREDDARGRHTTTHRQLIMLDSGVMFIDTPGMRELGLWDAAEGLGEAFADIENLFDDCKFTDCSHNSEPGCAVLEALEQGILAIDRWHNYLKLKNEIRYFEDKAGYMRERSQKFKAINKTMKNHYKSSPKR